VTITNVRLVTNKSHKVTQILVTFSGAVIVAEADCTATYRLASAGGKGSFTARNAKLIKLCSVVFAAATDTVTLTRRAPFALSKPVQLIINGTLPAGLQDALGRLIDGDRDGQPGGNTVVGFRRSGRAQLELRKR
jgi:hypothetical protein